MSAIERAAVIGAGTMGAGIAAHMANAGLQVVMLDLGDAAHGALAALPKRSPPPLVSAAAGRLIRPGSLEADLELVADADWIVEAIVEDAGAKRDLYARLDPVRKPGSVVSSNTSTIPLASLLEGAPDGLARDFAITHFFNPPRYMRLLEIVPGPATRPEAVDTLEELCDVRLGKTIVRCNDTPGFIANRLGVYWIGTAIGEALARGLTVEEADAVMGAPLGIPRTGVFGLMDIVGLGLHDQVTGSLDRLLPPGDAWHDVPVACRSAAADGGDGRDRARRRPRVLRPRRRHAACDRSRDARVPARRAAAAAAEDAARAGRDGRPARRVRRGGARAHAGLRANRWCRR